MCFFLRFSICSFVCVFQTEIITGGRDVNPFSYAIFPMEMLHSEAATCLNRAKHTQTHMVSICFWLMEHLSTSGQSDLNHKNVTGWKSQREYPHNTHLVACVAINSDYAINSKVAINSDNFKDLSSWSMTIFCYPLTGLGRKFISFFLSTPDWYVAGLLIGSECRQMLAGQPAVCFQIAAPKPLTTIRFTNLKIHILVETLYCTLTAIQIYLKS